MTTYERYTVRHPRLTGSVSPWACIAPDDVNFAAKRQTPIPPNDLGTQGDTMASHRGG
jgi:hypothetical protein